MTRGLPRRRRVLAVFHAAPVPPALGPARRHYHMLRELVKYHDVAVLSSGRPDDAEAFARTFDGQYTSATFVPAPATPRAKAAGKLRSLLAGNTGLLNGAGEALTAAAPALAASHGAEVVYLSTLLLSGSGLPDGLAVVSDTHNVEYDNLLRTARIARTPLARVYHSVDAAVTRRTERRNGRRSNLVFATSDRDASLLRPLLAGVRVAVVPNGVDVGDALAGPARHPDTLLFAGMMSYAPNVHGVRWFLDEVFPSVRAAIPGATLTVAGARPPKHIIRRGSDVVHVTGLVPSMQPYFETSQATVVPLWAGGGTRVKILEAMAAGSVVVTTSIGCEGLQLRDGVEAVIADTPRDFARGCARVLSDNTFAERLRRNAFDFVRATFRWTDVGRAAAHMIAQVGCRLTGPL